MIKNNENNQFTWSRNSLLQALFHFILLPRFSPFGKDIDIVKELRLTTNYLLKITMGMFIVQPSSLGLVSGHHIPQSFSLSFVVEEGSQLSYWWVNDCHLCCMSSFLSRRTRTYIMHTNPCNMHNSKIIISHLGLRDWLHNKT